MQDSMRPARRTRSPRACGLAVATLLSGCLLTACGGSSPNPTAATARAASISASSTTRAGPAGPAATTGSSAPAVGGATSSGSTTSAAGGSGPLAFAECMRANGVPTFPDPNPGGGFQLGGGIDPSSPAFKAAEARCQKILAGGGLPAPGSTTHPSAQTLAKLLKIARCVRQHGVAQFPDPVTSVPENPLGAGIREVSDFDGAILLFPSTINMQAPAYRQALTACGAPPLGLRH